MPTKTIAELKALVDTRLPTNNAGAIDAATLRSVIDDILDNEQVGLSGILTTAGTPGSTTYLRGDNTWASPTTGGTFGGTGDPGLTRAQAAATTFTTPPAAIRTIGYDSADDLGGGLYVKVTSQPTHKAKFQTVDGTWYELKHDGRVWLAQLGGKPTVTAWNARENDIADALNDCVDYIVFNRFGSCDLHIHSGTYYQTKTCQLKGGSFNVRGSGKSGTFIMPETFVTGFVAHHPNFSFEAFGTLYYNNRGWELGETWFTAGGTPGTSSAHCYICTQAGVSSADGSGKPTGTGTGYIDGTAKFDYYREATRVELTTTGWSGELSNMALYSHFDGSTIGGGGSFAQTHAPAPGPWPQFSSPVSYAAGPWKPSFGFLGRVRGHVHHVSMDGFSAHGCAFIANGDFDFVTITGNVNFWCVTDSSFYYNAMDGLHVSFSDGNAGYAAHIDVSGNGRWGIRDQSFLGNMYVQVQSANDGRASNAANKRFSGGVTHAGYWYYAKLGYIGVTPMPNWGAVAPTPGASNAAWELYGGDGTWTTDGWNFPDWVSGYHYEPSGCYASDNVNARNLWNSCYIEGGTWPAQFNGKDIIIGGLMQNTFIGAGSNLLNDGVWYNPVYTGSRSHDFSVGIGSGTTGGYEGVGESILGWKDGLYNKTYGLRTDTYESGQTYAGSNWAWAIDRGIYGHWIRSGQTSKYYGRSTTAAVPAGSMVFHSFFTGSDGDCRQIDFMDAVPTTGTWAKGDYVKNRNATVGQPKGWQCTVGGSPGTWVSEGNL